MRRLTRTTKRRAAAGVGAGVLFAAGSAHAACPLDLVPADAPPAWTSAARVAQQRLQASATQDCGSVEIAVRPSGGALLTFITLDGRRAVRALMSPDEIAPALDALLVTLPPEPAQPAPEGGAPAPSTPSPVGGGPSSGGVVPAEPLSPATPEVHFIVGAAAGVRFGLPGAYAAPSLSLRPSGTFGAWELAGTVEYDPSYAYLSSGLPSGFKLWSFIASLQVGRREALGDVALGYGLGLGVASIREEVDDVDGTVKVADFGQPRGSAYGRVVWPRNARLRATFEIGVDAALANFKKRATSRNDLPDLPRWGVLFSAGVETSAL